MYFQRPRASYGKKKKSKYKIAFDTRQVCLLLLTFVIFKDVFVEFILKDLFVKLNFELNWTGWTVYVRVIGDSERGGLDDRIAPKDARAIAEIEKRQFHSQRCLHHGHSQSQIQGMYNLSKELRTKIQEDFSWHIKFLMRFFLIYFRFSSIMWMFRNWAPSAPALRWKTTRTTCSLIRTS